MARATAREVGATSSERQDMKMTEMMYDAQPMPNLPIGIISIIQLAIDHGGTSLSLLIFTER